jgi:hypothetical protein
MVFSLLFRQMGAVNLRPPSGGAACGKLFGFQSGDGSLIDKDGSTWYTAREVMTNAQESADTGGEWNLSCHAPGNKLSANL